MKVIAGPRRRSPAPRARPRRTDLACTSEWQCPACAQAVALPERLARHIFRCAPELAMSTSPQWSAARAVIGEADEEESADAARRHEATWKSLNQRRKKAGPLSDRERAQALEALAFATRREATILKAASHIGFHAIHDTDGASKDGVEQDSNEAENSHVVFSPLIAPITAPTADESESAAPEHEREPSEDGPEDAESSGADTRFEEGKFRTVVRAVIRSPLLSFSADGDANELDPSARKCLETVTRLRSRTMHHAMGMPGPGMGEANGRGLRHRSISHGTFELGKENQQTGK